ncbi:efflux RND transporter permease subunit [Litoribacillus peritrichatus]|uniref:Efflux RND transporter permease subunit n=1 Tax=Litoribacillus peritrichatus TaxID=718191 RepID=A0ABP7N1I5_9GAMM
MSNNLPEPSAEQPHQGVKAFIHLLATHKVAANLLMSLFLLLGLWSLSRITTQMFPSFEIDVVTIAVSWRGASAEDVQASITVPIERELKNIPNIKEVYSKSGIGSSVIRVEVLEDADLTKVLDDVKQRVGNIRNLPKDAERPEINRIVRYDLVSKLMIHSPAPFETMRPLVKQFERELLALGIQRINIVGLPEQEIRIEVPSYRLQQTGLSVAQIAQQIQQQSVDLPVGLIGHNDGSKLVRSMNLQRDEIGFEQITITTASQETSYLGDIAHVIKSNAEGAPYLTSEGQAVISMELYRSENEDALHVAETVHHWLKQTTATLPEGITITPYQEFWRYLQDRIDLLIKNGLGGLVLVVAILFLFLNSRVAIWVAVGIPVSFMGAIAILYSSGGSINLISLFAFIMALGIIVDDAIVVGEDTLSHFEQGESAEKAAIGGANRMLAPVVSSSLTTICAFIPLLIIGGVIGNILKDIPIVVICVILASLLECFIILPGHLRHSMKREQHSIPGWRKSFDEGFDHFRDHKFRQTVHWAISHRGITVAAILATFILAITCLMTGYLKFLFFPKIDGNNVFINIQFHPNTSSLDKSRYLQSLEAAIKPTLNDLGHGPDSIQTLISTHNMEANLSGSPGRQSTQRGEDFSSIMIEFVSEENRDFSLDQFLTTFKKRVPDSGRITELIIEKQQSGPQGKPFSLKLVGQNIQNIKAASTELQNILRSYDGLYNISDDLPFGREQWVFSLTPLAHSLGLTTTDIGRQLRDATDGYLVQILNDLDDEIEVRVQLPETERRIQATIEQFPILLANGSTAPLQNLATFHSRSGMDILRSVGGELAIQVSANLDRHRTNANEVMADLNKRHLPRIQDKYNINVGLEGLSKEQQQTGQDMIFGAAIALILIFIVLAWVFESYSWPVAIMAAIPFGITGAIFGHLTLGIELTILSTFGLFALSGIVINDSIVLITFYKHLKRTGLNVQDAIVHATCLRLRAVLLTSLTTIAGLTPILFETSLQAQFLIPMATSIVFGLGFGTVIILLLVPCLLSYIESFNHRHHRQPADQATHNQDTINTTQ